MASSEHPADILPDDLDPSYGADIYQIPNNDKRKLAGYLYLLTGTILILSLIHI